MVQAAAIYARISSDRDDTYLAVERQLADCRALAARKGWPVTEEYVDNDISAYSGKRRPAYRRLLDDIKAGDRDAVIVWQTDRLHRQPKELEEFFEVIEAAGIRDLATVSGDIDLATDVGQMTARILGAVARKESDSMRRRIRRKHEELAAAGKLAGGGTRPFGFDDDRRTIRADEAQIVKELAHRVLAGDSLRSICSDLNTRGISTVTGVPWNTTVLRSMLMSGRISGQREHHDEIVGPAEWGAIVSPAETARLRAVLGDPLRRTSRMPRRYLLARMLRCSHCGATLVSRPKADGRRAYVCATGPGFVGCGKISCLADDLEALIVEAVLFRLDTPALANRLAKRATKTTEASAVAGTLAQDQRRLDELAELFADRAIGKSEWLTARRRIEARMTTNKKKLARMTQTTALDGYLGNASALREHWADLPLTRQQAIVAAVLDHVAVLPAVRGRNRFDPQRFKPVWRR